mmetsp:Transcript_14193/g.40233  ORF Transcript_14193/g.40233 Transcript_14193/m.40233 type:complete len:310 (+) Transcript_14193:111-1040(+)
MLGSRATTVGLLGAAASPSIPPGRQPVAAAPIGSLCPLRSPASRRAGKLHTLVRVIRPRRVAAESVKTDEATSPQWRAKVPAWSQIFKYLREEAALRSVEPTEAATLMKKGWVLLDVRPEEFFQDSRPAGSVNVQLFRKLEGVGSPLRLLKKALYQSQGTYPVEPNSDFLEEAVAAAPKPGLFGAKGVVVCCAEGGNMTPTQNLTQGVAARSLVAAYRLLTETDITNVVHLKGGINAWFRAGLPGAGECEWKFDQRTPSEAKSQEEVGCSLPPSKGGRSKAQGAGYPRQRLEAGKVYKAEAGGQPGASH